MASSNLVYTGINRQLEIKPKSLNNGPNIPAHPRMTIKSGLYDYCDAINGYASHYNAPYGYAIYGYSLYGYAIVILALLMLPGMALSQDMDDKERAERYFEKGYDLQMRGYPFQAYEYYTKAIRLDRLHMKAYMNRGLAAKQLLFYGDALRDFDRVILLSDESYYIYQAYHNRGIVLLRLNEREWACHSFRKAVYFGSDRSLLSLFMYCKH